jgi:Holliday junction resolvasome RuvABC endonuclease subunit
MSILGIDQSSKRSGWALLAGDNVNFGAYKTPTGLKGLEACLWQADAIEDKLLNSGAKVLAIEDIFLGENAHTAFVLGALRGMLVWIAHQHNVKLVIISSADLCNHLSIPINSERKVKKRTSKYLAAIELWGNKSLHKNISDDEADAFHIAKIAQSRLKVLSLMD